MQQRTAVGRIRPEPTRYRVIQLSDGPASLGDLNARGQVAFTEFAPNGRRTAKLYDGRRVRSLGTLGGQNAEAVALNNQGQVAGHANFDDSARLHAFRWSRATGMVDLGTLAGAADSLAFDINDSGYVVGHAVFAAPQPTRGVVWRPRREPADLGLEREVFEVRINDAGQVMGTTFNEAGTAGQAFSWTEAGGVVRLAAPGVVDSNARDINAGGRIVGSFSTGEAGPLLFLWRPRGEFLPLGDQPAFPFAVNDRAMVAGVLLDQVAFVWTRKDGIVNIGALPGGTFSNAYDVNNRAQVVGQAATEDSLHAFLWTADEGMVDLNSRLVHAPPDVELGIAFRINDSGAILAAGTGGALFLLDPRSGRMPLQ